MAATVPSICDKLLATTHAGAMESRTMMTSQDGVPVQGSCTFLCPYGAVTVSWKPSSCSESRVGNCSASDDSREDL